LVAVVASVALAGGVLLAAAAAAVCGTARVVARDAAGRRLAAARHAQLVMALRVLIGELESGARPPAALGAAAELAPAYAAVLTSAAVAAESGDAGGVLVANPSTRAIGFAWRLGERAGAELSGVLARVARDLAAQEEQRRSVAIALAGPQASAAVLAGLPLLGVALGAAMGARPWAFLIGAGPGRGVCCVGVLLDVGGVLWMRRILRRADRG
jgi:tight adherence protein B